jgi:hypothetical protein
MSDQKSRRPATNEHRERMSELFGYLQFMDAWAEGESTDDDYGYGGGRQSIGELAKRLVWADIAVSLHELVARLAPLAPATAPNDGSFIDRAACGAVSLTGTQRCTFAAGHTGRHGWQA